MTNSPPRAVGVESKAAIWFVVLLDGGMFLVGVPIGAAMRLLAGHSVGASARFVETLVATALVAMSVMSLTQVFTGAWSLIQRRRAGSGRRGPQIASLVFFAIHIAIAVAIGAVVCYSYADGKINPITSSPTRFGIMITAIYSFLSLLLAMFTYGAIRQRK